MSVKTEVIKREIRTCDKFGCKERAIRCLFDSFEQKLKKMVADKYDED